MADPTQKPTPHPDGPRETISGTFDRLGTRPGPPARDSRPERAWPIPAARPTRESLAPRPSHLPPPQWTLDAALHAASELAADLREKASEAEIARTFVEAVQQVVPGLEVTVRFFVDGRVAWFTSSAPLTEGAQRPDGAVAVSHGAMARARLGPIDEDEGPSAPVRPKFVLVDRTDPITSGAIEAIDALASGAETVFAIATLESSASGATAPLEPLFALFTERLADAIERLRARHSGEFLRSYLQEIFEHARGPIVAMAPDRTVAAVNRPALDLLQLPREQVLGRDLVSLMRADQHRERVAKQFAQALTSPATTSTELRVQKLDGTLVRTRWNTAPIFDVDGSIGAVVAMGEDLSDVQRLEQQILHAEKLATLGQIAAGILHELNNPLTSITVYSDYLLGKAKRAGTAPEDVERLSRIVESAARMTRFTRDLVTYARPNTEAASEVSVTEVIEQSLRFCEHVVDEAGVLVERRYEEGLPPIEAVRGQLHQIFVNLLTNAVHAMTDGGARLTRSAQPKLEIHASLDAEQVVVRVVDNGPGIPAERISRIFEPFFTTKGAGKGTGLGLSIVRNLVEQHGGTINVTSHAHGAELPSSADPKAPSGTCFELRFPIAQGGEAGRLSDRIIE